MVLVSKHLKKDDVLAVLNNNKIERGFILVFDAIQRACIAG
ncbi:hypothetical protein GNIT_0005 [Glaciecola nitratireducens FR1064]|uniref:Uncharacterized protein n=1 Tax=Glaciecola nitratireducens (strain JCM 12485 / KCTC 12276 / FR1064) TaxID=1085623 RepID=G4QED7_GLANF|nr:hypothetical protein GNIT_0005 [Glaciecola nitratireducens FR1064]